MDSGGVATNPSAIAWALLESHASLRNTSVSVKPVRTSFSLGDAEPLSNGLSNVIEGFNGEARNMIQNSRGSTMSPTLSGR